MSVPIKNILATLFADVEGWKVDLLRNWPTIIGSLHSKVHLEKVEDDTLVLGVYSSCWLQELYLLSDVLVATINQKLDRPRIKQIRFKKIAKKQEPLKKSSVAEHKVYKPVVLNSKEQKVLQKIEDAELSKVLEKFLIRCYQEKQ